MKLESRTIRLRLVSESDAEFILKLRSDLKYNAYLSSVDSDIETQIRWIRDYKISEASGKQYYFIIERLDGVRCGTIRAYDLKENSFCWGSWILNEEKTRFSAIESAFLIYQFGFETLGFKKSHFDVMKENEKVISFHKRMGAIQKSEDDNNLYFEIDKDAVESARVRLKGKLS
jgi:RimJ/RimL family protein N-acetyltransferase